MQSAIRDVCSAYRETLASPIRLLWVGLLPLIVTLAIDHIAARPFIEGALRPILDPASASASIRLLVDPEYFGMRPLGPIFWFIGDLPWILFVAIFLYRWMTSLSANGAFDSSSEPFGRSAIGAQF